MEPSQAGKDARAEIWLNKRGYAKEWLRRHMPSPWDKGIRLSALALAAFEGDMPMLRWLVAQGCADTPANRLDGLRLAAQGGARPWAYKHFRP